METTTRTKCSAKPAVIRQGRTDFFCSRAGGHGGKHTYEMSTSELRRFLAPEQTTTERVAGGARLAVMLPVYLFGLILFCALMAIVMNPFGH